MGRGPLLVYQGQEVGEPALGAEGFGGDDARTSIFDYWSMPEFTKWVNHGKFDGGRLSDEQAALRGWYGRLIRAVADPVFTTGEFYGLNHANKDNPQFGRVGGETVSGHWLYAFLRHDPRTGRAFLVVANFHGTETLRRVTIRIPQDAQRLLGEPRDGQWSLADRLGSDWTASVSPARLNDGGIALPDLAPCSAMIVEIGR
jgi:hypothetical protein